MLNSQGHSAGTGVWRRGSIGQSVPQHRQPGIAAHMTSSRASAQTRLILFGAALLLTLGMGLRQSLGLFLTPVTRDLAVTATEFTLSVAIQNIVWGLSQAPVGAIADRFGLRVTMMAGAGAFVVGLATMAGRGGGRRGVR